MTNLKISPSSDADDFNIDVKRLYLPILVRSQCPKCEGWVIRDLTDNYLSYPPVGKPFDLGFYHDCPDGSAHEWSAYVVLKVTLDTATPESTPVKED